MSQDLQPGDHIKVQRHNPVLFTHHGIYCGNNTVIHFAGGVKEKSNGGAVVREDSLENFAQREKVEIVDQPTPFTPEQIIERAKSKLGKTNYNLPYNNCEHFATWCRTGKSSSEQSENFQKGSSAVGGGGAGAAAAVVTTAAVSSAAAAGAGTLAGYAGLASAVSSMGLGGATTAIAAALGSNAAGAAATAVVVSAVGGPVVAGAIIAGGAAAVVGGIGFGLWQLGEALFKENED